MFIPGAMRLACMTLNGIGSTGVGLHHPWHHFAITRHRLYFVLNVPTGPWNADTGEYPAPWADVLDYACRWAEGATSTDMAAAMITQNVYALGPSIVTYDCPGGGSSHYSLGNFDCTAFIERLRGGIGNGIYVNCSDCATIVSTFANAVGCDLWQSRMGWGFALNELLAIGSSTWQTACGWGRIQLSRSRMGGRVYREQ